MDSTPPSQDTAAPAPKLVVDPPTITDTPAEPSPISKPNPRPKLDRRHSATVSEDSVSVSSQTSTRGPSRRKKSQQGKPSTTSSNGPSKLLNVQTAPTLSTKASTAPSSPNPAKDLPPHLAAPGSTTELKTDLDALVERFRTGAMDRPHTPGSHIDWADDDDSLPDLHDWGYAERAAASVKLEGPPASIPPIPEDVPTQPGIPEVKIEGEPSPDETKSEDAKPGPVSDATPRTHKVQKTRSKRGDRSGGNSRTQQLPPALNLIDSALQGSSLSPIQSTPSTAIPHTAKPREPRRQNQNQGQTPRNNQGQANTRDNGGGNGGGRQRGQNGAVVASPMRNSFPAKTGPKANYTPPVKPQAPAQGRPSEILHLVANPSTESDSKPPGSKGETVSDNERKKETPIETPRNTGTDDPSPNPAATNHTPHELVLIRDDPQPNSPQNQTPKRNSYNPSHNRAHTYGGRTQGGQQPPHSAPTPNFPHHPSNASQNPPNPQPPRSPNLRHSPDTRSSGLGPSRSTGYEKHNRNHSSPSWGGGTTRAPQQSRPMITGAALSQLAKDLGSSPGSPKRDPHTPPPAS